MLNGLKNYFVTEGQGIWSWLKLLTVLGDWVLWLWLGGLVTLIYWIILPAWNWLAPVLEGGAPW